MLITIKFAKYPQISENDDWNFISFNSMLCLCRYRIFKKLVGDLM